MGVIFPLMDSLIDVTLLVSLQVLMPTESKVEVLGGTRDTIPGSRPVYQLILSYSLSLSKQAEVRLKGLRVSVCLCLLPFVSVHLYVFIVCFLICFLVLYIPF